MNTKINITFFIFLIAFSIYFSGNSQDKFDELPTNENWTSAETFDLNGQVKSRSVSFFDDLGKFSQSQSKDIKTNKIWASQTLYDYHGRPALSTLSAPIGNTFGYLSNFIRNESESTYLVENFEINPENPEKVTPIPNTLGWYYSDDNSSEPYQDITEYPFSRTIFSELNPGTALKTIGGNKMEGEWKNGYSFTMPAGQELSQSVAFGEAEYNDYKILKTVVRDVHGIESVVFIDADGKTLAAARSGDEDDNKESRASFVTINEQGYVDVHIPVGESGIVITRNTPGNTLDIYDLITEEITSTAASDLPPGFYRVSVRNIDNFIYNPSSPIQVQYHENYYDYSLNEYDDAGRLISSKQPLNKLETTFQYNSLGQLIYTNSPDEGEARFKYRKDGQIRFSQNAKQRATTGISGTGQYSYTNYDDFGRPIQSGVVTPTKPDPFEELDPDGYIFPGILSEKHYTVYDIPDTNGLQNAFGDDDRSGDYQQQTFVSGNVVKTYTQNPETTTTWYSYDIYGRVKWIVQDIIGLGVKTIDYVYDPVTSQVTKVYYQKEASDQFIHRYSYDPDDYSLVKVETSIDDESFTEHATYDYYETGALKKLNLAEGLQEIDYVYNLNGALKSINQPELNSTNKDLFGMNLHYYHGDYQRNPELSLQGGIDQYNGNIKAAQWNTDRPGVADSPQTYYYKYDKNNWLEGASLNQEIDASANLALVETRNMERTTSETVEATQRVELKPGFKFKATTTAKFEGRIRPQSDGIDTNGDYNVYGITYDANGNIQSLNRNKHTENGSNKMDQLSYSYDPNKPNQLKQVVDTAGDVDGADDIGSQQADNYVYNDIGQLEWNKTENIRYFYNASGLVTEIQKDDKALVKFFYNDKNHRVRKESYKQTDGSLDYTEDYVRDAAGMAMAIYRNGQLEENTIYGSGRLGISKANGTSLYQLTDHLGNVRTVVGRNVQGQAMAVTSATDYYPFGMPMPNRNLQGDYRYAYQGQEKDLETGKEAFQLRLWDSRIGRWLSPDPYGQYPSPYLGMGNNPINGIDPDGGCFTTDKDGNSIPCPDNLIDGTTMQGEAGYEWIMTESGWARSDGYFVGLGGLETDPHLYNAEVQQYWNNNKATGAATPMHSLGGIDMFAEAYFSSITQDPDFNNNQVLLAIAPLITKGKVKPTTSVSFGKQLLLAPVKTHKHHIFNVFRGASAKSKKYRDFFKKHGIKVDDHVIEISVSTHKKVHAAGNNWTTKWKKWIDANPNASTKEVYQQAGRMLDEYGLSHVPIVKY